jgi:hypothetical protein
MERQVPRKTASLSPGEPAQAIRETHDQNLLIEIDSELLDNPLQRCQGDLLFATYSRYDDNLALNE